MNYDGIRQLLGDVFGANTDHKIVNGWVSIRCPLAPWTHESGKDGRASAGISIQDNNTSVFNCMTCKRKLPLQALVKQYGEYTGENLDALVEELEDEAYLGPRTLPGWKQNQVIAGREEAVTIDTELHLDLYDPAAGHWYLRKRGISDETADLLQLKVDPRDPIDGEERILFPVFNPAGELHGFSGRATRSFPKKDPTLRVRDYLGLQKAKCLLGSHLITTSKPKRIIVVEGLFDYANMWQQGYPAVAVMHSTLTEMQARLLKDFGLPVALLYDDDKAGQDGVEIAGAQLVRFVPVLRVRYPEIWMEDESEDEGGHWVKDPGELLAEDVEAMLKDFRLF